MAKKTDVLKAPRPSTSEQGNKQASGALKYSQEEKICFGLLALLVMLVYIIRSKFLTIPFERDEGIYSYFGVLVLDGKIPYKDFYEFKFPGLFYFFALIVKLFGATVKGMHTGFMYVNIITLVLIYFASRNLFSPIAGIISATTFAFVSLTPHLSGYTVQAEHGVALFIAMGLFFYSLGKTKDKWFYYMLMGASMGLAFMTKTTGVFLALWGGLIIITDFLFSKRPWTYKPFFIRLGAYSAGGFSVIGVFFLLIYLKGVLPEMFYWVFEYSRNYGSLVAFEDGVKYFKYTRDAVIQNHKFFWIHSILAVAVCLFKPVDFKLKALAVTLLAFSFFTIVPGYFFYGHYWIQIIPGLSLVAGLTFHCASLILGNLFKNSSLKLRYAYLVIFGLLTFGHVNGSKSYYFHPNYELILRQVYGNNPFPEAMEVANYINANAKPEDNIVLIGSEPQIYFYTNKRSPSRHAYFTTMVTNVPMHKEWQREFVKDTEKAKPRYVVFFNHQISLMVQPNTDNYVFEWANKYITENYKVVGVIDMINGSSSNYVWDQAQVNTYKPSGQSVIYVFERKPDPAQVQNN